MITILALVLQVLISLIVPANSEAVVIIPAMPQQSPVIIDQEDYEWSEYYADAFEEYADEFTALFNSYETKVAKNGAMMIRRGNSGSFKFAKKGIK